MIGSLGNIPPAIIRAAGALYAAGYRANDPERILKDIPCAKAHILDYCQLLAIHEDMGRIR